MKAMRIIPAVVNATMITAGLMYLMHLLVAYDQPELSVSHSIKIPPISEVREEKTPDMINLLDKELLVVEEQPQQTVDEFDIFIDIDTTIPVTKEINIKRDEKLPTPDNNQLVLVFGVPPVYPSGAVNGTEGYAVVEFSVAESGAVYNAFIVESEPGTIFDRSSLKAINKFKYKPRMQGGKAVATSGQQYMFTYRLEN